MAYLTKAGLATWCTGLLVAAALLTPSSARAAMLWYNGDPDGRDATLNATNLVSTFGGGTLYNSFVYDNFIVPAGQTWNVTSLFANIESNAGPISTATWQIRKGVSAGNGGTLVASGDGNAVQTPTGGPVIDPTTTAYTLTENIPTVALTSGTYWLTFAPDIPLGSAGVGVNAYLETTSGANAVGTPPGNDGNSFVNTTGAGAPVPHNYTPTSDPSIEGPGTWDYSLGVNGTAQPAATAVPEPSTLVMWAMFGLSGLAAAARRRLMTRRSAPVE
jgi:hypothetical protein